MGAEADRRGVLAPSVSGKQQDEPSSVLVDRAYLTQRAGTLPYWQQQKIPILILLVLSAVAGVTAFKYYWERQTALLFLIGVPAGMMGFGAGIVYFSGAVCKLTLDMSVWAVYYLSLGCWMLSMLQAVACTRGLASFTSWSDAVQNLERFEGLPSVLTLHVMLYAALAAWGMIISQKASHAHKLLDVGFIAA